MNHDEYSIPNGNGFYKTIRQANELGVDIAKACSMRMIYLYQQINAFRGRIRKRQSAVDRAYIKLSIDQWQEEIDWLAKYRKRTFLPEIPGRIIDSDVEAAKEYPLTELIDFSHGRAIAFCHDSDSYSMSYHKKSNRARCFVCNKSFGPIDVMMERDGMTFIQAVKSLSRGE
jgi:hypothetical protein